jgi:hypothetical protein
MTATNRSELDSGTAFEREQSSRWIDAGCILPGQNSLEKIGI